MKLYLLIFISACFLCCKNEEASVQLSPEQELVAKGIEATGGNAAWQALDSIQFYKKGILYFEDGSIEDSTYQLHTYYMHPRMEGKYSYVKDGDRYEVRYAKIGMSKSKNGESVVLTSEESEKLRLGFLGAQFVMCMPFKLGDPGVVLAMDGKSEINNKKVDVLKASYNADNTNHTKTHDWWYYFDQQDGSLEGYKVHHPPTYARVGNVRTTEVDGITFPTYRKSYRTDVDDNELYVRAEFWYSYIK